MSKFFNGGDKISETLSFSLPDGEDIHCIGHWRFEAAANAEVEVPSVLAYRGLDIHVTFAYDLKRRFGARGLVEIAPDREPREGEPAARSLREAKALAQQLWEDYCKGVILRWQEEAALIKSAGGQPRPPAGFVKRAMDVLGLQDPSEEIFLKAKVNRSELADTQAQVRQLTEQLARLQEQLGKK